MVSEEEGHIVFKIAVIDPTKTMSEQKENTIHSRPS